MIEIGGHTNGVPPTEWWVELSILELNP